MKEILLTKGYIALVDDEDYQILSNYSWWADEREHTTYARTHVYKDGKRTSVSMHRMILSPSSDIEVDHENHNGLDNRRTNIRLATRSENSLNRTVMNKGSVHWYQQRLKWRVVVKGKYVGLFSTKQLAEQAQAEAIATL